MIEPNTPKQYTTSRALTKTAMIQLDGMTWGDLREFVRLADLDGVLDRRLVCFDYGPDGDSREPTGLTYHTRRTPAGGWACYEPEV